MQNPKTSQDQDIQSKMLIIQIFEAYTKKQKISLLSQDLLSDAPSFTRVPGALPLQRVGLSQLRGEDRLDLAPQVLGSAGLDAQKPWFGNAFIVRSKEGGEGPRCPPLVSELYGVFFSMGFGALFMVREMSLEFGPPVLGCFLVNVWHDSSRCHNSALLGLSPTQPW